MNFIETVCIVIVNLFLIAEAKVATFFGCKTFEVKLNLIDSSFVNVPDETEYKEELDSLEEQKKVLKPIIVSLQKDLRKRQPFILTEGGNPTYKALRHKGIAYGPINLE